MGTVRANRTFGWKGRVAAGLVFVLAAGMAAQQRGMKRGERHESRHEIDQLEAAWRNDILQRNIGALSALLSDDYIGITAGGMLQSKDETLANLRSGALHFTSIEFSDRKVRFYGKTALVTSRAEVTGTSPEGDISGAFRYTRVYVRDDRGAWHIVSFEASRIRDRDVH
ncbi:MAG TPA: nuclear transport factor 2 family protein [Terracidiphilus sp.]|nr:nuclear transport factor 2 family protein [Terracidiphilus sp.]